MRQISLHICACWSMSMLFAVYMESTHIRNFNIPAASRCSWVDRLECYLVAHRDRLSVDMDH